jgi:phosphoglycerate dehydrogenase-like enzyme
MCMPSQLSILDDYQGVALDSADWSSVAANYDIDVVRDHLEGDELIERIADSQVIVAMRERTAFPRDVLASLPALRLLVTTGMGNAAIDLAAARELGITVTGTAGSSSPVPELTFGMIIALSRHLVAEDVSMHAGGWQHTVGRGLAGATLGIVGLGRLGAPVARIAAAFGMDVIAWSPNLTEQRAAESGATSVSKQQLFSRSDFVSVHVPLTESSRGLVGARELGWMRPTSYLINTSRGPIVDEAALVAALQSGAIAGAGLDVYDQEPLPREHPLRDLSNALLLPHVGYVTEQTYSVFFREAVEDIIAFDAGRAVRLLN